MKFSIVKKLIVAALLSMPMLAFAQKENWQNLDLKTDSVFGISTEKAYQELLKNKIGSPVLVAVLDGGVEIDHEDLKDVIWTNPKEIANNGKDDDHNGYIDDTHGWSFLGSAKGSVNFETLELTRFVYRDSLRFTTNPAISPKDSAAYKKYLINKDALNMKLTEARKNLAQMGMFRSILDTMVKKMGKTQPVLADFRQYTPESQLQSQVKAVMLSTMAVMDYNTFCSQALTNAIASANAVINCNLNPNYNARAIVGDNPGNAKERYYGCNDIVGPYAVHGTHVAGIIAANRTNDVGIKGVADHALIMVVRCVPNGDERDKDVANSIRYAADNGAKVINMSFGKSLSSDKQAVDEAVKYAMKKDALVIQAAGNDDTNLEKEDNFPNPYYLSGGRAEAYITVGASGWTNDSTLRAKFSNYGRTKVDVFAPGVQIRSTVPGSGYRSFDGTSMAAPVVSGLAALIRSYYPKLSALQVKEIILASVVKSDQLKDYCKTGGVVNAYNALKLAAEYSSHSDVVLTGHHKKRES